MIKFFSLLKAVTSQDMTLFKYKVKQNSPTYKKILLPLIISLSFMLAIGNYYYLIFDDLQKANLSYLLLVLALVIPVVLTLVEGIYKSQGILFDSKDNDLLFSLPIDKKTIILVRLIKMYIFQLLYSLLFILPAYFIYIYFERPNIYFYFISTIMIFLLPIIPTVVSSMIGYLIKRISVKFKLKKLAQIVITFTFFFAIYYLSLNINKWGEYIVKNALDIKQMISSIYYPIGIYINLINQFDIGNFIILLLINLGVLFLFIWFANITYFKIISKSKEYNKNNSTKNLRYKKNTQLKALVIKDLKRYFSSVIYVFNTIFGLVLMVIFTISISINFEKAISMVISGIGGISVDELIKLAPKVYYSVIILMISMTSITSSSISIEGKSFYISKTMPITINKILLSKIIFSYLVTLPFIFVSDLIFFTSFKVEIFDFIAILSTSILLPIISACLGLIINLKYPKIDASSDTEVVKQSMSSMISVLIGLVLAIILIALLFLNIKFNFIILVEQLILVLVLTILIYILKMYSIKWYQGIEV